MTAPESASILAAVEHIARQSARAEQVEILPHQGKAFQWLDKNLTAQQRRAFTDQWRASPSSPAPPPSPDSAVLLDVPYLSQRDSATSQGDRMCFSSSCAMAAEFLKPGCLAGGGQPDDRYLALLQQGGGDTTDPAAHVETLRRLGITARFDTRGDRAGLLAELRAGRPIAVGWLHHGSSMAPTGGGHWTLVIGWASGPNGGTFVHHDPYGEANLRDGGYVRRNSASDPSAGRWQSYSWANWSRRWMVDGVGTGWSLRFS